MVHSICPAPQNIAHREVYSATAPQSIPAPRLWECLGTVTRISVEAGVARQMCRNVLLIITVVEDGDFKDFPFFYSERDSDYTSPSSRAWTRTIEAKLIEALSWIVLWATNLTLSFGITPARIESRA